MTGPISCVELGTPGPTAPRNYGPSLHSPHTHALSTAQNHPITLPQASCPNPSKVVKVSAILTWPRRTLKLGTQGEMGQKRQDFLRNRGSGEKPLGDICPVWKLLLVRLLSYWREASWPYSNRGMSTHPPLGPSHQDFRTVTENTVAHKGGPSLLSRHCQVPKKHSLFVVTTQEESTIFV